MYRRRRRAVAENDRGVTALFPSHAHSSARAQRLDWRLDMREHTHRVGVNGFFPFSAKREFLRRGL